MKRKRLKITLSNALEELKNRAKIEMTGDGSPSTLECMVNEVATNFQTYKSTAESEDA